MPNITKRTNKVGQPSYRIRVYVGEDVNGKQLYQSMTWTPPAGMRPSSAEKEVQKQAALFEDKVKQGLVSFDGKTRFGEYCRKWLEVAQIAPKTKEGYEYLMQRIEPALGHIQLEKLQAHHLEAFYLNLREVGIKAGGGYATPTGLCRVFEKSKLSKTRLSTVSGVAQETVTKGLSGKRITGNSAKKLAAALGKPPETLFSFEEATLSDETVIKYHRLIRAVLAKAKRERIIPFNVAAEHVTPPKSPRREAKYLDDEQAQRFLSLLSQEGDIRIKTALILLLFTGVRRGELCGLSWPDCDTKNHVVSVKRASQYQIGKGTVEVSTKNDASVRAIDVPSFVSEQLEQYRNWWIEHRLKWGSAWRGEKERLFVQDDGKPINPDTINYWMAKFLERHDLPHVTPHSLRHTFATLQLTAGVDFRTLQSRTGHSQASTLVNTYSHAVKSAQERATAALEAVLLPEAKHG